MSRTTMFFIVISLSITWGEMGTCGNCANGDLTVTELTDARIQFIKQQILKKLRLSKKPAVAVPVNSLPMPVAQGQTLSHSTDKPPEFDDYYGRTEQKIIFPVEGKVTIKLNLRMIFLKLYLWYVQLHVICTTIGFLCVCIM